MTCPQCGRDMPEGKNFCTQCGCPLETAATPKAPQGKIRRLAEKLTKRNLILAACAAGLILLAAAAGWFFLSFREPAPKDILYCLEKQDEVLVLAGDRVLHSFQGAYSHTASLRAGKALILFLTRGADTEVYYLTAKKQLLTDTAGGFDQTSPTLSGNGKYLTYLKGRTLVRYKLGKSAPEVLSERCTGSVVLSPNGKSLTYTEDGVPVLRVKKKVTALADGVIPLRVGDGGKYLLYQSSGGTFVDHGKNTVKLSNQKIVPWASADMSEIVFADGDKTFISRNGAEKERILDIPLEGFVRDGDAPGHFAESFALSGSSLIYLDKNLSPVIAADNVRTASAVNAGTEVYYTTLDQRLYAVTAHAPETPRLVSGEHRVDEVRLSPDGKHLYYRTGSGQLFYKKGDKEPSLLSESVHAFAIDPKGTTVFMLCDFGAESGTLYTSKKGAKRKKIEGIGDVYAILSFDNGVFAATNVSAGAGTLFYSPVGPDLRRLGYDFICSFS